MRRNRLDERLCLTSIWEAKVGILGRMCKSEDEKELKRCNTNNNTRRVGWVAN
jgi:hypothetical protein